MTEEDKVITNETMQEKDEDTQRKNKSNRILTILAIALLLSFLTFGALFVKESAPYWKGNKAYADMNKKAVSIKHADPLAVESIAEGYI